MSTIHTVFAILFLSVGLLILSLADDELPDVSQLSLATGQLNSLEKVTAKNSALSSFRFTLTGDQRHFQYTSKGGNIIDLYRSIEKSRSSQLSVLFDPHNGHTPPFDQTTLFSVYEIRIDTRVIRSYEMVANAWRSDNVLGTRFGYGSIAISLVIFLCGIFSKRKDRRG